MFNIQTVNYMQYSEWICYNSIIKLDTQDTSKPQEFALIEKKLLIGP